jgi:hypothetical protein
LWLAVGAACELRTANCTLAFGWLKYIIPHSTAPQPRAKESTNHGDSDERDTAHTTHHTPPTSGLRERSVIGLQPLQQPFPSPRAGLHCRSALHARLDCLSATSPSSSSQSQCHGINTLVPVEVASRQIFTILPETIGLLKHACSHSLLLAPNTPAFLLELFTKT